MGQYSLHGDLVPELEEFDIEFHKSVSAALLSIYQNLEYQNVELFDYLNEIKFYEGVSEELEAEEEFLYREATCEHCSHPIKFHKIDVSDMRTLTSEYQLEFEFVKNLPSGKPTRLFNRITAGICSYCETEYFVCVNCDELNMVDEDDRHMRKECVKGGCHLPYYIAFGEWYENFGYYLSDYFILIDKKICNECSELFKDDGSDNVLCSSCLDYHYYDDIEVGFA